VQQVQYTVDSESVKTAIAKHSIPSNEPTGTRYNYLLPQADFTYDASLTNSANQRIAGPTSFSEDPCENLPTYGKTPGEQVTLVIDHYRTEVLKAYRIYRNPKLEQLAQLMLDAGSSNISYFLPQVNGPDWRSMVAFTVFTDADAGSLVQILLDDVDNYLPDEQVAIPNTMSVREIGFVYDSTEKAWLFVLANRTRNQCSNGLLDAGEQCDDGNKLNYDGCSSSCTIEDGWSCPDDPLHSGSICVTTPAYVPVVVTPEGQNPNSPSGGNTPSGNAPSDGNSPSGSNNPSTGSPSGSTPDQQQTSGSSKVEVLAITVAYLVALLY
jgi:cysteine-rich repeat protein